MNTRQVIDESIGPYSLSAAFNSDSSCFSVGLNSGFCGKRLRAQVDEALEELQTMEPRLRRVIVQCSMPIRASSRFPEVSLMTLIC